MTKAQHTQGPWKTAPAKTLISRIYAKDLEVAIASYNDNINIETRNANARLIAAAPDLLQACEDCLLLESIADSELGDMLRAVIKKAKGN